MTHMAPAPPAPEVELQDIQRAVNAHIQAYLRDSLRLVHNVLFIPFPSTSADVHDMLEFQVRRPPSTSGNFPPGTVAALDRIEGYPCRVTFDGDGIMTVQHRYKRDILRLVRVLPQLNLSASGPVTPHLYTTASRISFTLPSPLLLGDIDGDTAGGQVLRMTVTAGTDVCALVYDQDSSACVYGVLMECALQPTLSA